MSDEYYYPDPWPPLEFSPNYSCPPKSPVCYKDISRLPNELLEYIFLYLAPDIFWTDTPDITQWCTIYDPWYLPEDYTGPDLRIADLIHISHVSMHWRTVALNCPTLWSNIFVTSLWWTAVSLPRSRGAALKIEIDMEAYIPYSDLLVAAELILSHVERIKELRVRIYSWDTETARIFSRLFSAASKLQILEISFETAFGRRGVRSMDIPAPWEVLVSGGLTNLSLHTCDPLFQLRVTEFHRVLRHMPGLEYLELGDVLRNNARDLIPSPALQKVDLLSLSRLFIVAPLLPVVALLSRVNIPSCKQLKIDCGTDFKSPDGVYDQLYPILAQLYNKDRAQPLPTIRSMALISSPPNVSFVFSTSDDCDYRPLSNIRTSFSWASNVLLELCITLRRTQLDHTSVVNDICALMPTSHVSDFQIHISTYGRCPLAHTLWRIALGHLPSVRRMTFSDISIDEEFAPSFSLFAYGERPRDEVQSKLLAPELEEIEFNGTQFLPIVEASNLPKMAESDFKLPPFRDLKPIFDALSNRNALQTRLVMTKCTTMEVFTIKYDMVAERDGDELFRIVESEKKNYTFCSSGCPCRGGL